MARMQVLTITTAILALGLAGCDEKKSRDGAATASVTAGSPSQWNAADACSILGKADVTAALKQDVKETQLGLVHEAGAADAATSECNYVGSDGARLASVMTRWSPINDNTTESIATARSASASAIKAFSNTPLEDIPGLGKAAFFVPSINQLNVFIDDARMIMVTVQKVPDGVSGKETAIALAQKAGA